MDKDPVIESIKKANSVKSDISTARMAMSCMDYASLNGEETVDQIQLLCQNAITEKVGGVCVYSPHVRMVSDYLKETDIAIATVINFPLGDKTNEGDIATYDNTYDAVCNAITDGATEIDIVIDYNDFTEENAKELLRACRKACDEGNAKMKVILVQWMEKHLPADVDIIATHPVFGPESGKNGIEGQNITIMNVRGDQFDKVSVFLSNELKLNVIHSTPAEHDQQMAYVQGLTHLISKILKRMDIPELQQTTRTYDHLLSMVDMIKNDSPELFHSIQTDNPYVHDVTQSFFDEAKELETSLQDQKDA